MRKLLFILVVLAVLVGCEKNDDRRDILLDSAPLHIYPAVGVKSETNPLHLSSYEIVKLAYGMAWKNDTEGTGKATTFFDGHRDLATPKFIYPADRVIYPADTTLNPSFLRAYDMIFNRMVVDEMPYFLTDTIAYIPNDVMREAERLVTEAFNRKDYLTCYEIFDSLYIFKPITGAEWRALKKEDNN